MNKATGSKGARGGRGAPRPGAPIEGRPWRRKRKKAEGPLARKNAKAREEANADQAAKRRGAAPAARDHAKPDARRDAKPEAQRDARPATKPAGRREAKPDTKPAGRREAKPDTKPAGRREAKPETRRDAKPHTKAGLREAKPEPRRTARPDAKAAGRRDAKPEPARRSAKPETQSSGATRTSSPRPEAPTPARTPRPALEPSKAMLRDRQGPVPQGPRRSGTVAIVGRSNVGKSTLLNAALEMPLAIVSPTPQTTRDALLGVVRHGTAEVALLDTPGIFEAETALDRAMVRAAQDATSDADVVVFVTAVSKTATQNDDALRPHKRDLELLRALPANAKVVVAVNKIDLVRDKARMLPMLAALNEVRAIAAVVPISALREDGIRRVLDEVAALLPEGEHRYGEDDVTDRPARFFAREYVREQILLATHEEVPHSVAVTIDTWTDGEGNRATRVAATIHVERAGQKKILVGTGGSMLQRIGSSARARLAELVGGPVHLELFVRVTENWRNAPTKLGDMGYGPRASDEGSAGGTLIEASMPADADDEEDDEGADLDADEDES